MSLDREEFDDESLHMPYTQQTSPRDMRIHLTSPHNPNQILNDPFNQPIMNPHYVVSNSIRSTRSVPGIIPYYPINSPNHVNFRRYVSFRDSAQPTSHSVRYGNYPQQRYVHNVMQQGPMRSNRSNKSKQRRTPKNNRNRQLRMNNNYNNYNNMNEREREPILKDPNGRPTPRAGFYQPYPNSPHQRTPRDRKGMCKFYAAGYCRYGPKCNSLHNPRSIIEYEQKWVLGNDTFPLVSLNVSDLKIQAQKYDYLAVLDLEGKDEIIELPAMFIDLKTFREVKRFHRFVRPTFYDKVIPPYLSQNTEYVNLQSTAVSFKQAFKELCNLVNRLQNGEDISSVNTVSHTNSINNIKPLLNSPITISNELGTHIEIEDIQESVIPHDEEEMPSEDAQPIPNISKVIQESNNNSSNTNSTKPSTIGESKNSQTQQSETITTKTDSNVGNIKNSQNISEDEKDKESIIETQPQTQINKLINIGESKTNNESNVIESKEEMKNELRNNNSNKNNSKQNAKTVLFAICGNWDFKTQIPKQCKTSQVGPIPEVFDRWLNIKDFCLNQYTECKPLDVKGMAPTLRFLGMELYGNHHLGMDDTANIGRVALRFIKDGGVLERTAYRMKGTNKTVFIYPNRVNPASTQGGKKLFKDWRKPKSNRFRNNNNYKNNIPKNPENVRRPLRMREYQLRQPYYTSYIPVYPTGRPTNMPHTTRF